MVHLKCSSFLESVGTALYDLQKNGDFCDLYLTCAEGDDVALHTCVAAAASPFLKSVLESVGAGGNKDAMGFAIPVRAVQTNLMNLIVQFIYTGELVVEKEDLVQLLNTADYLGVDALSELCKQEINVEIIESTSDVKEEAKDTQSTARKRKLSECDIDVNETEVDLDEWQSCVKNMRKDEADKEDHEGISENREIPDQEDNHPEDNVCLDEKEEIKLNKTEIAESSKGSEQQRMLPDFPDLVIENLGEIIPDTSQSNPLRKQKKNKQAEDENAEPLESTPVNPVRFSKRIRGAERSKILDLIKGKAGDRKTSAVQSPKHSAESHESNARIVSEEEESSLFDGWHYSCLLCERTFSRKILWVLHLHQEHDFEVESITKDITDEDLESVDDADLQGFDASKIAEMFEAVESSENNEELSMEEREAIIKLIKAKRLMKSKIIKIEGIGSKKTRIDKACPVCGKFFKYDTLFDDHMRKHSDPKPYKCDQCPNRYATKSVYLEHLNMHAKVKYECNTCFKTFQTARRLRFHESTAHSTGNALPCDMCEKKFKNEVMLQNHVKNAHCGKFTCEICGKTVMTTRKNEHMNLHTAEETFECTLCDAVYKQKSSLENHRKTKHERDESEVHQCFECNLTFVTKQSLEKHLLRHTGNKKFTCSTCGAQFYTKGEVDQHEGYHLDPNKRPWVCQICQKTFTREYTLKSHMLVHSTEKPFACEYCGRKFRWKNKLKEHVRVHTGEKPFQCRLCEARFPDCALRRHHEKKHHAEEIARNPAIIPKSATRSGSRTLDSVQRALIEGTYEDDDKEGISLGSLSAMEVSPEKVFSLPDNFITVEPNADHLFASADSDKKDSIKTEDGFLVLDNKPDDPGQIQVGTIENTGTDAAFSSFVVVQNAGSFYVAQMLDKN